MRKSLFAAFFAGILVACGGGVQAISSEDAARLSALESTTVQQATQIAALQAAVGSLSGAARPAVFITAPAASFAKAMGRSLKPAALEESSCSGLGTLTGRPDSSNPITSNLLAGVSCSGYLYVISQASTGDDQAVVQGIPISSLYWTANDCTGPAYVQRNSTLLSTEVFISGAVFRLTGSPAEPTDPSVASNYLYVPAGATPVSVVAGSFLVNDGPNAQRCVSYSEFSTPPPTIDSAIAVLPNDPAVTGIPSAPIAGPISISNGS